MKKIIPIFVSLILIVGGGSFYGGMKYQQNKNSIGNFFSQNLSEEQRQQFTQGNASAGLRQGMGNGGTRSGFISGEVIAKDSQSLTLKIQDGSSRIVFFSGSSQISKTTEGSINDIEIGKQLIITGNQNSDGSYTAKTIQLSPNLIVR